MHKIPQHGQCSLASQAEAQGDSVGWHGNHVLIPFSDLFLLTQACQEGDPVFPKVARVI